MFQSRWHTSCGNSDVKMAKDNSPVISEAEAQRRAQLHDQLLRRHLAKERMRLRQEADSGVRTIFILLLGAAIVMFLVAHRNEINSVATKKIERIVTQIHSKNESSSLRQGALNYEKEVNDAGQ